MIDLTLSGVYFWPLKQIRDTRGSVMHMIRSTDPFFDRFGEVYFSTIKEGFIKAWKMHEQISQNLTVPCGKVRFVLYDKRPSSETYGRIEQVTIDTHNYGLLQIPTGVWYGFQGLAPGESVICNCTPMPHNPCESKKVDIAYFNDKFNWNDMEIHL